MSTNDLALVPVGVDNPTHMAELRRQRVLCGWGVSYLPGWERLMRVGDKCLYWIQPTDPALYPIPSQEPLNLEPGFGPPPPDPTFQPLGHVALDREDYLDPPLKVMASRDTGVVMLASLFILKSQQGRGLGNKVLALCEAEARRLGAPMITLDTMQAKDAARPEFWDSLGPDAAFRPDQPIMQNWYARQDEVFAEDVPRYHTTNKQGEPVVVGLALMRKLLKPAEDAPPAAASGTVA